MSSNCRTYKKPAMRKKIRCAAPDLFTANGFDNVTVEQIADVADVSSMTFCRHFGTKEAVIVDVALIGSTGQAIHREATLAPVAGTPEEVVSMADPILDDSADWIDDLARRLKLVHDNPRLQDLLWQQTTVWTVALETLLAGDGLGARARACAIVGAGVEARLAWPDREGFPSASTLRQCLREAVEVPGWTRGNPPQVVSSFRPDVRFGCSMCSYLEIFLGTPGWGEWVLKSMNWGSDPLRCPEVVRQNLKKY